jgi:hypothetical protein
MTNAPKRRLNLVEDFQPRSIDVNELHYVRAFGEKTVTFRSVEFHHPWLNGLRTDRYAVQMQFRPGGEWLRVPSNGPPAHISGKVQKKAAPTHGGHIFCAHIAAAAGQNSTTSPIP